MHVAFGVFAGVFLQVRRRIALLRTEFTFNLKVDKAVGSVFAEVAIFSKKNLTTLCFNGIII